MSVDSDIQKQTFSDPDTFALSQTMNKERLD